MAFTSAIIGPPIPDVYYDQETASRTIQVQCQDGPLFKEDMIQVLSSCLPDFSLANIDSLWKTERSRCLFLTLKNCDSFKYLMQIGSIQWSGKTINFTQYHNQIVSLRIHWLPADVRNSFLANFFKEYGKVLNVNYESQTINNIKINNGIRIVTLEIQNSKRDSIPHIVRFGNRTSMLVTCPGRLPICLRCHMLGHLRMDCPRNTGNQRQVEEIKERVIETIESSESSESSDEASEKIGESMEFIDNSEHENGGEVTDDITSSDRVLLETYSEAVKRTNDKSDSEGEYETVMRKPKQKKTSNSKVPSTPVRRDMPVGPVQAAQASTRPSPLSTAKHK